MEVSPWRALIGLLVPHRARVAGMAAVLATAGALPLAGPLLIGRFIDDAVGGATATRFLSDGQGDALIEGPGKESHFAGKRTTANCQM